MFASRARNASKLRVGRLDIGDGGFNIVMAAALACDDDLAVAGGSVEENLIAKVPPEFVCGQVLDDGVLEGHVVGCWERLGVKREAAARDVGEGWGSLN